MTARAALTAGTALSAAVTAVWSFLAAPTSGPDASLNLTGDLPGDYLRLSSAATGSSPWALAAVLAVIYALCFLASGLRARRKARREAARDLEDTEETEAALASAGRWQ